MSIPLVVENGYRPAVVKSLRLAGGGFVADECREILETARRGGARLHVVDEVMNGLGTEAITDGGALAG